MACTCTLCTLFEIAFFSFVTFFIYFLFKHIEDGVQEVSRRLYFCFGVEMALKMVP